MAGSEEIAVSTLEQAREWVGTVLYRVGSSFRVRKPQSFQSKEQEDNNKAEKRPSSICQRISLTTIESETKGGEKVRISSIEMEIDQTTRRSAFRQQGSVMSGESDVSFDFKDQIDIQHGYSTGLNNFTFSKIDGESNMPYQNNLQKERRYSAEESDSLKIRGTEDIEETFSRNFSTFCETMCTIQSKADEVSKLKIGKRFRCSSLRKSLMKRQKKTKQPCVKDECKAIGRLKLSLQYFEKSRQLRVILLFAETAVEENKSIFCKIALTRNNTKQKKKTRKVRINSRTAKFNESFFMATEAEDLNGYSLCLQLCKVSRVLQRQSTFGEAKISLEELDISLDTTIWVNLWDPNASKQKSKETDMEITSENRSIHAEVMGILQQTDDLFPRSPALSRCRSLPHMSRYGININRLAPARSFPTTNQIHDPEELI